MRKPKKKKVPQPGLAPHISFLYRSAVPRHCDIPPMEVDLPAGIPPYNGAARAFDEIIITIIQNKPQFMELWGREPDIEEMYLAVVEALPKEYTEEQFKEMAQELFPENWERVVK
jgi:hypothetical protein